MRGLCASGLSEAQESLGTRRLWHTPVDAVVATVAILAQGTILVHAFCRPFGGLWAWVRIRVQVPSAPKATRGAGGGGQERM